MSYSPLRLERTSKDSILLGRDLCLWELELAICKSIFMLVFF